MNEMKRSHVGLAPDCYPLNSIWHKHPDSIAGYEVLA